MTGIRSTLLRLAALIGFCTLAIVAQAIDLDPRFGVYGYVPVSAPETQVDTVASIVRQPDERIVVLGTRRVGGTHGILLLQRYSADSTPDFFFGTNGTTTIDIAGESLTAKQLFVQADGKFLVAAESILGLHFFSVLANGQLDSTFGVGGELQVPVATGVLPGTSSVHLLETGMFLVISQNTPGANNSLSVSRYLATGVIDDGFGLHGREIVTGLGAGITFTGVSALLIDGRLVVALAGNDGTTRGLLMLDRNGQADTGVNGGRPVFPAPLQGKTITKLAPLLSGSFLAVAVSGAGGAQTTTITRFDNMARVDPLFGTGGTLTVESADAGGSIAITDAYETPDNTLVVTGSTNNGIIVARYFSRGQTDTSFNNGKGVLVIAEPGSRATVAVTSLQLSHGQIVHAAYGVLFGAGPAGRNLSRAFLISTVEGRPDASYGSTGIVNLFGRVAPASEFAQHVIPLADGKVLVLSATGVSAGLTGTLSRYLADGSPDPTFGVAGRSTFLLNGKCEWPLSIALQPDGRILILGTSFNLIDCGTSAMYGKRFTANGTEENFSLIYSGVVQRARSGAIALQSDGRIVITGQDDTSLVVARYLSTGASDPSFGTNGHFLWPPAAAADAKGGALLIRPDQKILVAGSLNGVQLVLMQLNANGTLDASFGVGGTIATAVPGSFLEVYALAATPAGKLLVLARSGQRALLAQFAANGAPDLSFGSGGQLLLPLFIGGAQYSRFGMAVEADGGIVVSGQTAIDPSSSVELIRLQPNGQNDTAFGVGGAWTWRPSVFYPSGATGVATAANGSLYVIGYGIPGAFLARLGASVTTAAVIEFFNNALNHYFITADPAEQTAIDGGSAGPGWSRTGMGFRAYTPATGIPAGLLPVCRFYGSTAINPATGQRRGPNSHFYTAEPAECAAVQQDAGWTLEGIAFYTSVPGASGCPAGLIAVFRNYNKRAQFNDSNHRYTTDFATYQQMISMGWAGEGIVFCSAP
jgi:uncharacterized delta-60 repeat protein